MDKGAADGIQQRPRGGATRCPYCHDLCEAGQDACACADCLSRHHLGCWEEAGGCSSCRSVSRLLAASQEDAVETGGTYGEVIDAWLRLGLAYNVGLAGLTLLLLNTLLFDSAIMVQVGIGAFLANLGFLSGPALELLARRFGFRNTRTLRWILFFLGSSFAALLALASCLSVVLQWPWN